MDVYQMRRMREHVNDNTARDMPNTTTMDGGAGDGRA